MELKDLTLNEKRLQKSISEFFTDINFPKNKEQVINDSKNSAPICMLPMIY